VAVDGEFERGEAVQVLGPDSKPVAVGLSNYRADEARKLIRAKSGEIMARLGGYTWGDELIHRDNLVLL
jgi:glutamate 5-kinase